MRPFSPAPTALLISLVAAAGLSAFAFAEGSGPAGGLLEKDSVVCLQGDAAGGNQFQHLKLFMHPAPGGAAQNLIAVNAVERGTWTEGTVTSIYFNTFSGTGTVISAADNDGKGSKLAVSLAGSGVGYKRDGTPELWQLQYALELDPVTLSGTLFGVSEQSARIVDGANYGQETKTFLLKAVRPTDCGQF